MQLGAQGSVVQFTIRVCSMSSERPEYWRRNAAWVFSGRRWVGVPYQDSSSSRYFFRHGPNHAQ